jgi:phage-related protein
MYDICFYKDNNGNEPIRTFLKEMRQKSKGNKEIRIRFSKIVAYINQLGEHGTIIGEPFVKHIEDDIWELRPTKDRIFFFCWHGNSFVLLHHYVKKTQKTPRREIEQAKRNKMDFIERRNDNE